MFSLGWAGVGSAAPYVPEKAELQDRARTSGQVRVMVRFAAPGYGERLRESRAFRTGLRRGAGPSPAARQADDRLARLLSDAADNALAGLALNRYRALRRFATLPVVAMELSEQGLADIQSLPGVEAVYLDRLRPLVLPETAPAGDLPALPYLNGTIGLIGADTAWAQGYSGQGWYVAILDTGILNIHEFFQGKTIVEACFARGMSGTGECPNGSTTDYGPGSAAHHPSSYQGWDHGTHVAGIAAGSKADGSLKGVAPDAGIIAVNVFSMIYTSYYWVGSYSSDQIAGLEYIYSLRATYNIGAVNMSLGGGSYNDQAACDSDLALTKAAVDNLRSVGIATVIASGNDGYCDGIGSPGCISSAVAVGAADDSDTEASFSNWQASLLDIFAPGVSIYSSTADSDTSYQSWNGTSMATPHAAGAWTLLRQRNPGATVDEVLAAVTGTGPLVTTSCGSGGSKPRIQVDTAINSLAPLSPPAAPGGPWLNLMLSVP